MVMHSNQRWTSQNLRLKLDTVFHVSVSDRPRIFLFIGVTVEKLIIKMESLEVQINKYLSNRSI